MLEDIARGNRTKFPEKAHFSSPGKNSEEVNGAGSGGLESLGSLFQQPALAGATLIQIFSWYFLILFLTKRLHSDITRFVNSAAYYGLTLAAGASGGGLYQATALSGAVEVKIKICQPITTFSSINQRCLHMC